MMARLAILPLLLWLAGCAGGAHLREEVIVSGARFQAVQGEASLIVRSFTQDQSGAWREVLGADCEVVTSLYAARLHTPALLVVPNFGPQSPRINVACRAGALSGEAAQTIRTSWRGRPGYYGYWGPYGWDGPGGWPGYGPSYPVSRYPDIGVVLR